MKRITTLFFVLITFCTVTYGQLDNKYSKFLILRSQQIDYFPVWGETDEIIYANLNSKEWRKYDLSKTKIQVGFYYQDTIAINTNDNYSLVTETNLQNDLETNKSWQSRIITDKLNRKLSLIEENFNTDFYINDEKIMTIDGNAHSISISPSGRYVAFLLELTGLMIFDIEKELNSIREKREVISKMTNIEKAEYFFQIDDMTSLDELWLYMKNSG